MNSDTVTAFLTLFFWLLMGLSTGYFAKQRGRDPFIWFLIGIFFGLLGLVFLFLLPIVKSDGESEEDPALTETLPSPPQLLQRTQEFQIKDWYYLDSQHIQKGPIAFHTLRQMFQEAQISKDTFVWSEGMSDWKKIADFEELQEVLRERDHGF